MHFLGSDRNSLYDSLLLLSKRLVRLTYSSIIFNSFSLLHPPLAQHPHPRSICPSSPHLSCATMAAALSQLSACVTRILSLTGFPKELKTRDIQAAFSEWDNVNGGFKIKWINDTSLLIVFNDATVGA